MYLQLSPVDDNLQCAKKLNELLSAPTVCVGGPKRKKMSGPPVQQV